MATEGSIYLGDTVALPSELAGATIVVQARDGQSWTTTVTAVLDRSSGHVIVTDSGGLRYRDLRLLPPEAVARKRTRFQPSVFSAF